MDIAPSIAAARAFIGDDTVPMWVDGAPVTGVTGATFTTYEPSVGEPLAELYDSQAADVDAAVESAARAFASWRAVSPTDRQNLLLKFADAVEERFDELAAIDSIDYGGPIAKTRLGRRRCADLLRYNAGLARTVTGDTIEDSLPFPTFSYTVRQPVGVVAAITPWNAPIGSAVWKIAPALAAGCTVVLKPSPEASLSSIRLAQIATEVGFPPGVFNVVTGGAVAGSALTRHPKVAKVTFTGSTETGRAIIRDSAVNITKVTLELGGKSANIVFPDADLEKAARMAATVAFQNSGQVCAAGTRLFVHRSVHDEFVDAVVASTAEMKLGPSLDPESTLGPLVSQGQQARVKDYIASAQAEGASLAAGGEDTGPGYFVQPAVFCNVRDDMRVAREEVFGPVLSVMAFDDTDEVISRANASEYGLGAMVWTRDLSTAHTAAARLEAGAVWVNAPNALDPAIPFGGVKQSGIGRESGKEHILDFLETKSVLMGL